MEPTKIKVKVELTGDTTANISTSIENGNAMAVLHGLSGFVQSLIDNGTDAEDIQKIVSEAIEKAENTQS